MASPSLITFLAFLAFKCVKRIRIHISIRIIMMLDTGLRIASRLRISMHKSDVSHQYPHPHHENADAASVFCDPYLEGERGHFILPEVSNQDDSGVSTSTCLWILQLHYETNIRYTLDALSDDSHLHLYPEDQLSSCNANSYTRSNSTHIGSSFEFHGKTLIIILPDATASVAFSWDFLGEDNNNSSGDMKNSDYVSSPNGLLEWEQLESVERVTWGINTNANLHMRWDVDVATSCDAIDKCACFHFAIFELTSGGVLSEALRTCGQSSEGKLEGISGRAVVLIKVNTKIEANKIAVSWELDNAIVTEPPVTEQPEPTATGLFAATNAGLIALNLQTLEATALTSEPTLGVAVNHNLQKVYWSEGFPSSSIIRSNFNGSAKEVIVPQTGDWIDMLGVDEASGNVYFALFHSHEIIVCNALGDNCAAIISNSSLVNLPIDIAVDSKNGFIYWGKRGAVAIGLVRAKLDGSNAAMISTEFTYLSGIILDSQNEVLYCAGYTGNTIGTIDVDGGNRRTLVELEGNPRPWGIQLDATRIYIGNSIGRNIQSAYKDSGAEFTTIFNTTDAVRNLALYNCL